MRNRLSDDDSRILDFRQRTTRPMLDLLIEQMDCPVEKSGDPRQMMATVVLTGFERVATVVTTSHFQQSLAGHGTPEGDEHVDALIRSEARLMEMAIRDARANPG
jgi:hypothetical protein